mgnify:CR=1 FL=1
MELTTSQKLQEILKTIKSAQGGVMLHAPLGVMSTPEEYCRWSKIQDCRIQVGDFVAARPTPNTPAYWTGFVEKDESGNLFITIEPSEMYNRSFVYLDSCDHVIMISRKIS